MNMLIEITIPDTLKTTTIKDLLENEFLIPRKIRHFLRTKKHVLVNGQHITWQSEVVAGDFLQILFDDEDYPEKDIPFGNPQLVDCIYEDEHLIVVNKPEGMKTHGNEPTEIALLNHVSAYSQKTCYVVHRLDKETSGLVLFAKNPFVLPILNRLLEKRLISRHYWAITEGHFSQKKLTYNDKIGRHRHDRRKRIVDHKNGQNARTIVTPKAKIGQYSLVDCQLKTGRTHQIRVHLAHHDHAILGDPLYHNKPNGRLMLHAHSLSFLHPFSQKTIHLTAKSESFEKNLNTLKS